MVVAVRHHPDAFLLSIADTALYDVPYVIIRFTAYLRQGVVGSCARFVCPPSHSILVKSSYCAYTTYTLKAASNIIHFLVLNRPLNRS
jgi:hypothetical protein